MYSEARSEVIKASPRKSDFNKMRKKIRAYIIASHRQFIKYFLVGGSGFILDMGTLILLKEYFAISAVLAVIINQVLILSYNFSLNKWWSFRNREMPHWQLVRYIMLAVLNYGFSVAAMYIFNEHYGFDYRLVRIASVMVMVSWNFFLYKHWVYRKADVSSPHAQISAKNAQDASGPAQAVAHKTSTPAEKAEESL